MQRVIARGRRHLCVVDKGCQLCTAGKWAEPLLSHGLGFDRGLDTITATGRHPLLNGPVPPTPSLRPTPLAYWPLQPARPARGEATATSELCLVLQLDTRAGERDYRRHTRDYVSRHPLLASAPRKETASAKRQVPGACRNSTRHPRVSRARLPQTSSIIQT